MHKTREDYMQYIIMHWNANRIFAGSKNTEILNLADHITGLGVKDAQEVEAIQTAINSVQPPFELTWGEAISAFSKGAFSFSSSVEAEREIIVAGKLADAIVAAVEKYEAEKKALEEKQKGRDSWKSKQQELDKEIVYDQTMKFSPETNVLPENYNMNNVRLKQMESKNALTGGATKAVIGEHTDEQSNAKEQTKEPEIINGREVFGPHSRKVASKGSPQVQAQPKPKA